MLRRFVGRTIKVAGKNGFYQSGPIIAGTETETEREAGIVIILPRKR